MTTYLQTLMHLVKGIIGAGIFSMGVAFKNAGMVVALIFTPIMGVIVCHCATLLVRVTEFIETGEIEKKLNRNGNKTNNNLKIQSKEVASFKFGYPEIVELAIEKSLKMKKLKKFMKYYVTIALCTMNLGFSYVVFIGTNMEKALSYFGIHIEIHIIMLMCIVPMWLLSLITKLEILAPFSMIANVLLFTAIVSTFYFVCQELPRFDSTRYVGDISALPIFAGIALYTYECIALIVPLRNAMEKPDRMVGICGVLNVGFLIITPFVVATGALAYMKYGENISGTVFINLPETATIEILIIVICVQVVLTFPIQLYVPVAIIWPLIVKRFGPFKRPLLGQLCFRTGLVAFTLLIGELIPFIHLIIALIGVIFSTSLTLFIPPFLDLIIFYPKEKSHLKKKFQLIKNCILCTLAIGVFTTGIFVSVKDIAAEFKNNNFNSTLS